MAVYNEILSGRFNRALQKLFSMKGSPPAPQLAGEIGVTHNLNSGVENLYLEGWNLYANNTFQAAVAASLTGVRLRNPTNSGVIMVVQKVSCFDRTAANDQPFLTFGAATTDLATISPANGPLDSRSQGFPAGIVSRAAPAAALAFSLTEICQLTNVLAEFIIFDDQEIPILPGFALQVISNNVNQGLSVTYRWRERTLEDSEKT